MSKRETREKRKREKAERKRNNVVETIFQTGGWYEDNEAFAEYDEETRTTRVPYTHPAPTTYVSESDKKEQEWYQTQDRMYPIPAPVNRFSPEALVLKADRQLRSELKFTSYFKRAALIHNVVTLDHATFIFTNDAFEKKSGMESIEVKEEIENTESIDTPKELNRTPDDRIPFEDIYDDLRYRHEGKKTDISYTAMKQIIQRRTSTEGVNVKFNSWKTDPIGEYSIDLPDKYNWNHEEAKLQWIHNENKKQFLVDFTKISGVKCNYILTLHTGLQPELHIHFNGRSNSKRLLFRNHVKTFDDAMLYFNNRYKHLIGVRQLNMSECNYMNNHCLGKTAEKIVGNEALELLFGSKEEFELCLKDHEQAMFYPRAADNNLIHAEDETVGIDLTWYPYPSTLEGEVILKHPKDVGFACWVLFMHGFHAQAGWKKYEPDNKVVELSLAFGDSVSHDTEAFTYAVKKILDANELEYDSISLIRFTETPPNDEKTTMKIHQRIGRSAVCCGLWDTITKSKTPGYDEEWFKFINDHMHGFPWTIKLHEFIDPMMENKKPPKVEDSSGDDFPGALTLPSRLDKKDPRLGRIRKATVYFKDVSYGNTIINYLLPISPRWDTFALSHKDKQGVKFDPFFQIRRHVPPFIRGVLDDFIKNYDEQLRQQSDREKNDWCQFIDTCHAEQITIKGWPIHRVQEAADELDRQLKGTVLDCSDPDMCGKLLHWPGVAVLNFLQAKHCDSVIISLNRLEKQIIIIGNIIKCESVKEELKYFCRNRNKYKIEAEIRIDEPRFLPSFKELVNSLGYRLHNDCIHFTGSIVEYESFQKYLDEQQQIVLESFREDRKSPGNEEMVFRSSKCPICLNKVAYSNYRLAVCGHLYCMECLCSMISFSLQNKELPIRCIFYKNECHSECHEFLAISDILYLMYDNNFKNYPLFFKDRLQTLINVATDYAIQNNRGLYRPCTKPDCNGIFCRDLMSKKEGGVSRCDVCLTKICNKCLYPPHTGTTCEMEAAVRESSEMSISFFLNSSRGKVQRCPGDCGGIIEKNAGCNHMQCRFCKIHFCWLCQFKSHKEPEIYGHMRDVHNGTGGEWDFLDQDLPFPPGLEQEQGIILDDDGFGQGGFGNWVMIDGNRFDIDDH